jgi:RimJ/RimL family protein N-acetyltransferase
MELKMEPDDDDRRRISRGVEGGIRLQSERLELHKPHRNDLAAITREIGKAQVARYLAIVPHPYTFIDATNWFGGINASWGINSFTFGIYEKNYSDELIGVVSIDSLLARNNPCPSLGYWLALDHWGRGLMSEAVGAVLAFAFDRLNAPCIEATYLEENPSSGRVMVKNGFRSVERTMLWSRYRMSYLPGHLMRCEIADWSAANENLNVLVGSVGET